MDRLEALRKEVEEYCEKTNTRPSGINYLVHEYYMKTMGQSEEAALKHVVTLFKDGVIEQIKLIGKDGEEL